MLLAALASILALVQVVTATGSTASCTLIVPPNPLTPQGLATPYILQGCSMAVPGEECFVEGVIYNPFTNTISIYNPLVIDDDTVPAVYPTPPNIPEGSVVGLWFGTNAGTMVLAGDKAGGNCVDGLASWTGNISAFGQFAYCNAPTFFAYASNVQMPPLGTASDGQPCLTSRDFAVVDQDQSDTVVTTYILTATNQTAQNTIANRKALNVASILGQTGGPDELLLVQVDTVMGCTSFSALDLAETSMNSYVPALALNEIHANRYQQPPMAIVPDDDPMTLVNGNINLAKVDLYRVGVFQSVGANGDSSVYCRNLINVAPARFLANEALFSQAASPDPTIGTNMFTYFCARFVEATSADGLNCPSYGLSIPITVVTDENGVAISAQITLIPTIAPTGAPGNGSTSNNGSIIGAAIGGIVGGFLILVLITCIIRKWNLNRKPMSSTFSEKYGKGEDVLNEAFRPDTNGGNRTIDPISTTTSANQQMMRV